MAIGVGLIGAGMISDVHLKGITRDQRARLMCIADTDEAAAARQAEKFGAQRIVSDYREMLDDPSIEVIDIAGPVFLHCPMTIEALEAGKDVICEKPMALNLEETDRMISKAKETGRQLLVKKYQRFSRPHEIARELINNGDLGRIYLGTASTVEQHLDQENDPNAWRGCWDKAGGGALLDFGIHKIDLMQFFFGRARAVTATTRRLICEIPEKAEDLATVTIEYESGGIATILSFNCDDSLPKSWHRQEVYGTKASLQIHEFDTTLKMTKSAAGESQEIIAMENWWEEANIASIRHLLDCLVDGVEPVAPLSEVRHDLEVAFAAYRSSEEGRRIVLDPISS